MTIRPYTDADADPTVRLALRAWAPVFESMEEVMDDAIFREFYPDWQVQHREAVEAVLADSDQSVWIAEREGIPIGFVSVVLHEEDSMGEVHMIAVDPEHQGEGAGAALTDFAVNYMRKAGMAVAMVETGSDPGHAPARRLYERSGFQALPITRFFKKL